MIFWLKVSFATLLVILVFALPFWLIFGFSLTTAVLVSLAWLVMGAPAAFLIAIASSLIGDAARFVVTAYQRLTAKRRVLY